MATDYLLAVVGLALGSRLLLSGSGLGQRSQMFLGGSFLALALGAFLGGTAHGFAVPLGETGHTIVWRATMVVVGLTSFLFLATAAFAALKGTWRRALFGLAALELVVYVVWVLRVSDDFRWAIYDYVPAMLAVGLLMGGIWLRGEAGFDGIRSTGVGAGLAPARTAGRGTGLTAGRGAGCFEDHGHGGAFGGLALDGGGFRPGATRRRAAGWIVAGILASFVGAGVQMSGFALHRHFNHNDLYHVIQAGALYLLFRGGMLLRDA